MKTTVTLGGLAALVLGAGALVASQPDEAQAQVAAKVESQTRPNFGVLLDPPTRSTRSRGAHHRRWRDYGRHRPDYRPHPGPAYPGPIYAGGGSEEIVLVDCGGNPGSGAVEAAVRRVRPGGTMILRSTSAGGCVGWLNIDKPMTIIGESAFDVRSWGSNQPITLQAPDGFPCMTVSQGVRVEVRDVLFASPRGGEAACLVGYKAEFVLSRVGIQHAGEEPAIYLDGGLLDVRSSRVEADTLSPAIVVDDGHMTAHELVVGGARSGVELNPAEGRESVLTRVKLKGLNGANNYGPRSVGLKVGFSGGGRAILNDSKVCGYDTATEVEGGTLSINESRLCVFETGVLVQSGEAVVERTRFSRGDMGVVVESGHGRVTNNVFAGLERGVWAGRRGNIIENRNRYWGGAATCGLAWTPVYRDRYAPYIDPRSEGAGCQYASYPRDWWQMDEAEFDLPYKDYVAWPEAYDRFHQGWGWYDCRGRYVADGRYYGEERWRSGGWGPQSRECPRPRSHAGSWPGIRLGVYGSFDAGIQIGGSWNGF